MAHAIYKQSECKRNSKYVWTHTVIHTVSHPPFRPKNGSLPELGECDIAERRFMMAVDLLKMKKKKLGTGRILYPFPSISQYSRRRSAGKRGGAQCGTPCACTCSNRKFKRHFRRRKFCRLAFELALCNRRIGHPSRSPAAA